MAKTSSQFFGQWPEPLVAIIASGAPNILDLGTMTSLSATQQLDRLGVMIFKRGLQPTVTMQVKAYRDETLIGTSDLWTVADIEAAYAGDNFLGWCRFRFNPRVNLAQGDRFELELSNYTFDEFNTWIGAVLDWPVTMGTNAAPGTITSAPVALELYAYGAIR